MASAAAMSTTPAQAAPARKMTVKVSEKGAISVYGFGRFPFTFYRSQFDALFTDENISALRAFRKANEALMSQIEQRDCALRGSIV